MVSDPQSDPQSGPQSGLRGAATAPAVRHILISSMKDEGPYILEWVAHHLVLGFDRICVASNDCSDGSERLLAALDRAGYLTHVPNVLEPGDIPQHAGYAAIRARAGIDQTEWLMMLDADEFLNVHAGGNRVGDLTGQAVAEVDVIALNGMCFTGAPEARWQPGRVCPRFPYRLRLQHRANFALKSLTRGPERFKGIHNHSLVGFQGGRLLRVMRGDGGSYDLEPGVPLWKQLRHDGVRPVTHDLAQYNHYPIKTRDAFRLRQARGRGAVPETTADKQRHTDAYFAERSVSEGQDRSIGRYEAAVAALMADMLADRAVRRRQRECDALYGAMAARVRA